MENFYVCKPEGGSVALQEQGRRLLLCVGVSLSLPVVNTPQREPFQPVSPDIDLDAILWAWFTALGYKVESAHYMDFDFEDEEVEPRPGVGSWLERVYVWGEVEVTAAATDGKAKSVACCASEQCDDYIEEDGFDLFSAVPVK